MDFRPLNPTRDDDFPALTGFCRHELGYSLSCRHPTVSLTEVADPDLFIICDAKIDTNDRSHVSPLQFPQPLMRDIKTPGHGNGEHASRKLASCLPQPADAVSSDQSDTRLWSQMNEHRH